MDISKYRCKNRIFAISSGLIVGLVFIFIFNLADASTVKFIPTFYNMIFLSQGTLTSFLISISLLSFTVISAGVVTNFMLPNRNCIFGGLTGIFLIFFTLIIVYSFGTTQFPILVQIKPILGLTSIVLVFLIYAVPTAMIGFILGYLGSYIVEHFSFSQIINWYLK